MTTAIVIGAGIGGLTTAVALRRIGIDVTVYEASGQPRTTGTGLGIASNATAVLDALDIDIRPLGAVVRNFELFTRSGALMRRMPIAEITAELGAPIVTIHRNALFGALRAAAGDTAVHYGAQATRYTRTDGGVRVDFADGAVAAADLLIGADGFRSVVRAQLQGATAANEYGYICWLATTSFTHPRVTAGFAGHYWGAGERFGLMDIGGGNVYWWGTKNVPVEVARDWQGGKAEVAAAYADWAPEVRAVIAATEESAIVGVPAQDRRFSDQWGDGPVTLVGDAAHPMLTSLSQGAGSAIEDGYVLAHHLATASDPVAALRNYEQERIPRTRKLVAGSRRLSRTEQLEQPIARAVRDLALRYMPSPVVKRINAEPMRFDVPVLQAR